LKNRCVFVVGPESSGSRLIAKIIAHALGVQQYGEWNANYVCHKGAHKVYHLSLPSGYPSRFPDIKSLIDSHRDDYDMYFVLTTRDTTISETSRLDRFRRREYARIQKETMKAREMMIEVIRSGHAFFIWSYETFIFLGKDYLNTLYAYLGLKSDFMPPLEDGNKKRIINLSRINLDVTYPAANLLPYKFPYIITGLFLFILGVLRLFLSTTFGGLLLLASGAVILGNGILDTRLSMMLIGIVVLFGGISSLWHRRIKKQRHANNGSA
jgi:hypothetical protein